ncbi:MAG: hypothetical protein MI976_16190 [Pseudomonadales bacterium]|nr:hypothetical protein [Pseudomonadales bacterium]
MKKLIVFSLLSVFIASNTATAAPEDVSSRKVTRIRTFESKALIDVEPVFTGSQGCSKTQLKINFDVQHSKQMYSALLAAVSMNKSVGFGVDGCDDGNLSVYRVTTEY